MQRVLDNSLKYGATIDNESPNGSPRLFYALNELCVVLDPAKDGDYARIRQEIGGILSAVLDKTPLGGAAASPLERDLQPTPAFAAYLRERGNLGRLFQALDPGLLILPAPPASKVPSVRLAFYRIALGGLRPTLPATELAKLAPPEQERVAQQQAICQLINLLNLPLLATPWARARYAAERRQLADLGIVGVTPNWGFAAQPHFCPSPGSLPVPVEPKALQREADAAGLAAGRWHFGFRLAQASKQGEGEDVTVVILDTCPERSALDDALKNPAFAGNGLLLDALTMADDSLSLDPATLASIDPSYRMNLRQDNGEPIANLELADHGIFIAGIVRDIAPQAKIHLGRVLNGFGVSNLRGVVLALDRLAERFPQTFGRTQGDPQRLIVNLSLGASLPPDEELLLRWLPAVTRAVAEQADLDSNTYNSLSTAPEVIAALTGIGYDAEQRYLNLLCQSVGAILAWANAHPTVLIVAAAGNDKDLLTSVLTDLKRPAPRWPAQFDASAAPNTARSLDRMLGVAAVNLDNAGTEYSNRGDVPPLVNGIAVWGGEARHNAASELGTIPFPPTPFLPSSVDAIKGVFSAPSVQTPCDNETGWVYWSGTSFAAPIITGLAARLWSVDPTATPNALVRQIVDVLPVLPRTTGLDDLFTPIIEARQRWQ